jgi:ribosome-associated protein
MTVEKTKNETKGLITNAIEGMREKKGHDIVLLDLSGIENAVCNSFVICHGTSKKQVEAIADSVYETVKKNTGQYPWHKEGYQNADWILLDYVDVVVHIFAHETRKFYNLEALWADAERENIND